MHTPPTPAVVEPRRSYRVPEAATALRVSRQTIYNLIRRGQLRYVTIGSIRVIPASEIDRILTPAANGGDA